MSGLVHSSDLGASGLSSEWRLFRFTASNGAWSIPTNYTMMYCEVIGAGGGGGGGVPSNGKGGGGGGGGAFAW